MAKLIRRAAMSILSDDSLESYSLSNFDQTAMGRTGISKEYPDRIRWHGRHGRTKGSTRIMITSYSAPLLILPSLVERDRSCSH